MKISKIPVVLLVVSASFFAGRGASAQLIPNPDGLTVYDPVFQVNWLADANLAHTQTFQVQNINQSGSMDFATAKKYLEAMNAQNGNLGYLNHNTWQLPATPFQDEFCDSTGPAPAHNSFGYGCVLSAQGNLYYNSFHISFPDTTVPIPDQTVGPFHNFQPYLYWSDTQSADPTQGYHAFSFDTGFVGSNVDKHQMYALPMIPGKAVNTNFHDSGIPGLRVSEDGQMVYDSVASITWLANANLAQSEKFNTPCSDLKGEVFCINDDGSMAHTTAEDWVANMRLSGYLGQSNWQLPPIPQSDSSCSLQGSFGFHCDGNPMGILYYDRLKLNAGTPVETAPNIYLQGFKNLQPYLYWGCTQADQSMNLCQDAPAAAGFEWSFSFGNGFQGTDVVGNNLYVMVYYPETPAQALAEAINEELGSGPEASALLSQADGISSAPTLEAKAGKLQAFVNHVNAQRGNALSPAEADYLIALAGAI